MTWKFFRSAGCLQLIKFCIVGASGVVVDMAILCVLADRGFLAMNLTFSKICAAEAAMASNFTWNEFWTFQRPGPFGIRHKGVVRRFLLFNAICGIGVLFAIILLHVFYTTFNWNLYVSNCLSILMVTLWNFGMNSQLNWRTLSAWMEKGQ